MRRDVKESIELRSHRGVLSFFASLLGADEAWSTDIAHYFPPVPNMDVGEYLCHNIRHLWATNIPDGLPFLNFEQQSREGQTSDWQHHKFVFLVCKNRD